MTGAAGPASSWELRARAESFGAVAEEYDAARPGYPAQVVSAVVAGSPPAAPAAAGPLRVLDVGTGTGILARAMVAAGAAVTGSELDEAMAAVARRSGLTVHVGRFEQFDVPERFDRITAAQAWHWIEPAAGLAAARRLLAPGGQLWLIWNVGRVAPPVEAVIEVVYAEHGGLAPTAGGGLRHSVTAAAVGAAAAFFGSVHGAVVTGLDVPWAAEQTTAQWLRTVATFSDHATLPAPERARLLSALAAAVDAAGGVVRTEYTTRCVVVSGLSGLAG